MRSKTSEQYVSNRAWLRDAVGGDDLILRCVSALEFLQLFVGYAGEEEIEVYAKQTGAYTNINYHIVDTFDGIEFTRHGNVMCTSVSQTINDMLRDYENTDEQALAEALSKYYYSQSESFDGLRILPENVEQFERVKEYAIQYFCGG